MARDPNVPTSERNINDDNILGKAEGASLKDPFANIVSVGPTTRQAQQRQHTDFSIDTSAFEERVLSFNLPSELAPATTDKLARASQYKIVVDEILFGANGEERSSLSDQEIKNTINDKFRATIAKYWSMNSNDNLKFGDLGEGYVPYSKVVITPVGDNQPIESSDSLFFTRKDFVSLEAFEPFFSRGGVFSYTCWKNFLIGGLCGVGAGPTQPSDAFYKTFDVLPGLPSIDPLQVPSIDPLPQIFGLPGGGSPQVPDLPVGTEQAPVLPGDDRQQQLIRGGSSQVPGLPGANLLQGLGGGPSQVPGSSIVNQLQVPGSSGGGGTNDPAQAPSLFGTDSAQLADFITDISQNEVASDIETAVTEFSQLTENFIMFPLEVTYIYDHSFKINVPFSKEFADTFALNKGTLFADIAHDYNYYYKTYEETAAVLHEALLPNIYYLHFANVSKDLLTHVSAQYALQVETPFASSVIHTSEYIRSFLDVSPEFFDLTDIERNKNVFMSFDSVKLIKDISNNENMFPMNVNIEFSTDQLTHVAQMLKDSKLIELLSQKIARNDAVNYEFRETFFTQIVDESRNVQTATRVLSESSLFRTWSINEFLDNLEQESSTDKIGIVIGNEKETIFSDNPRFDFFYELMKIIFIGKIRRLIREKFRTFKEILDGELAYSETALYRIEKIDDDTGEVLQNIYLPNSNDIDVMRYVDTQVKYGKHRRYKYRIYAEQLVIGTRYHYQDLMISEKTATFFVEQSPSIKIIEVPYYEGTAIILDKPPIWPEVKFVPYKGMKDKVLILLNSGIGEYRAEPVSMFKREPVDFSRLMQSQKSRDGKLIFKSDDYAKAFEIFRIDKMPTKYSDFFNSLIQTKDLVDVSSAAFVDNIIPNKKYYYLFRSIDVHDHVSNPSIIFELEMVENSGAVYLVLKPFEFMPLPKKTKFKQMRKYLQIQPKLSQTLINRERSLLHNAESAYDSENVFLGTADETFWNKNFKIRLTSKKTGRKIDLNIQFQNIYNRTDTSG